MAILQPAVPANYTLQTEIASRVILLTRNEVDNNNGTTTVSFGCQTYPRSTTYEVDANGNRTAIYDSSDLPCVELSSDQLNQLYGIQVTLADGTVSYVGELLANFTDQIIAQQTGITGTIDTQNINIANVLNAQSAQTTTTTSGS